MKGRKHIQNQFEPRHCEEQSDEAISQTEVDCRVGSSSLLAMTRGKVAVLLVNFGGPDSLRSVKPFLYNLFSDKKIIGLPTPLRQFVAWMISTSREKASGEMYKEIGSKSPLIPITYLQSQKLQELFRRNKINIDVFLGFRYCKPFIEDSLDLIKSKGYEKIVVLSLYPQYSYTTTGSTEMVVEKWKKKNGLRHCEKQSDEAIQHEVLSRGVETTKGSNSVSRSLAALGTIPEVSDCRVGSSSLLAMTSPVIFSIKDWFKDEDYIQSYTNQINNALENLDLRSTELLFSAHSIPIRNILKGDPYEEHIKETVKLIVEKLNWKKKWHLAYQSKLGPVKWLEPSCEVVIEEIAKRNQNASILVVPISFVCEHVETIYEIGMLYKEFAIKSGIKTFRRVPALNTDKFLIQALYNQVLNALESNRINIKELLITHQ